LAGEEECRATLSRIDHGHGMIGMQRNNPREAKFPAESLTVVR
jgi:hypothetical protein